MNRYLSFIFYVSIFVSCGKLESYYVIAYVGTLKAQKKMCTVDVTDIL